MTYTPTAREALDRVYAEYRASLHTSFPAKVVAYDVAKQTVDLAPALAREVASDDPDVGFGFEALPTLVNVPVMWPRAGGHAITFPLKVGDWMLVVCAEQSTMLWRQKGTTATHPALNDPHGLNGTVALPGWFPDAQKLANVSATDLVIGDLEKDATVRIKPNGEVHIAGADGSDYVALAKRVDDEIGRIWTLLTTTWKPTGTTGDGTLLQTTALDAFKKVASTAAKKVKAR